MGKIISVQIKPTLKQKECWSYLKDDKTKFVLFGGGAGGGKSWLGCEWCLILSLAFPGIKLFIGRNELKRIMSSTYITWLKVCREHNIPRAIWKLNSMHNYVEFVNLNTMQFDGSGSRIDLLDVAYKPSDPLYERFGSTEYTCGWLEEVGEIKEKAFDVLKSRIGRHKVDNFPYTSKMFLTCNPKKNWAYYQFYKPWKEGELPEDSCFIRSLYTDNPYTAEEYEVNLKSIRDKVLRERLMNGNWEYDDDSGLIIEYDKIINMFHHEMTEEMNGEFFLSVDVARAGRDKAVIILWQGLFIKKIWYEEKSKMDLFAAKIKSKMAQFHVEISNVVIDEDGVGGGLVDMLFGCRGFVNGSSPVKDVFEDTQDTLRQSYTNLRSQCYFKLAELINKNQLGCYSDVGVDVRTAIIEELEIVARKDVEMNERKLQIVGKDEYKATIGRSPDFADAIMMRMYFELGLQANFEIAVAF